MASALGFDDKELGFGVDGYGESVSQTLINAKTNSAGFNIPIKHAVIRNTEAVLYSSANCINQI